MSAHYPYHRVWNVKLQFPEYYAFILDPASRPMFRRKEWYIFDYNLIDDELEGATSARVELEIQNPGIGGIFADPARWLVVWEEYGATQETAEARILCIGRIIGLPTSVMGGTIRVNLDCKSDYWEAICLTLFQNNLPSDIPLVDILPYKDRILSLQDFIDGTWYVPRVDPTTLDIDLCPIMNRYDVMPGTVAPGHIDTPEGKIYDLTDFALEDMDMSVGAVPAPAIAGQMTAAWNQRANGGVDLSGPIQTAFIARAIDEGYSHCMTYTPEALQSSLPQKGQQLTTGVKIAIANYDTIWGNSQANKGVPSSVLDPYAADGFEIAAGLGSKLTARYGGFKVAAGAWNGLVGIYDYHQPRSELINIVMTFSIQDFSLNAIQQMEFRDVPLNDPTVFPNLKLWKAGKNYAHGDVVFDIGYLWYCLFAHTSFVALDPTKFMRIDVPLGAGAAVPDYDESKIYMRGSLAAHDELVYICVTEGATGPFNAVNWLKAADISGLVTFWRIGVLYAVGQIVNYNGVTYYCTIEHVSGPTFDASKFARTPLAATSVPLAPAEPEFFSTPRGATSIIWQQVRLLAVGLKRALAIKGTLSLKPGVVIDGTLRTDDIRKGTKFRLRKAKLPGPYEEIFGIVTSVNKRRNVDTGENSIKIGFKISIGNGATDPNATAVFGTAGFQFTPAYIPVDTRFMASPATYISIVSLDGMSFSAQWSTIASIAGDPTVENAEAEIQNALQANPTRLRIQTKPLNTLDIPPLDHGAMVTGPMWIPRGIVLS